ncbi:putative protein TPRXL [Nematostella vectensis]|uniref:putative protein TPRXL n=1 Tax=Nematostella vectensis TaxID=45351 RepID=UPI00138FB0B7|nr:putative protein TPRXL [Nematostella vectensis]
MGCRFFSLVMLTTQIFRLEASTITPSTGNLSPAMNTTAPSTLGSPGTSLFSTPSIQATHSSSIKTRDASLSSSLMPSIRSVVVTEKTTFATSMNTKAFNTMTNTMTTTSSFTSKSETRESVTHSMSRFPAYRTVNPTPVTQSPTSHSHESIKTSSSTKNIPASKSQTLSTRETVASEIMPTSTRTTTSHVVMPTTQVLPSWTNWTTEPNCERKCCGIGGEVTQTRACIIATITLTNTTTGACAPLTQEVKCAVGCPQCASGTKLELHVSVVFVCVIIAIITQYKFSG